MNLEKFIEKAKIKHNNRYDYSLVTCFKRPYKVKIICKEHGVFEQSVYNHLVGQNCPICIKFSRVEKRKDFSYVIPPEGASIIPLTKGKYALVDEEDYERVNQYNWFVHINQYASTRLESKQILLHRFIMDAKKGEFVDHINFNGLDNRKINLRICSKAENQTHQRPSKNKFKTAFKGVYWIKSKNKWRVEVSKMGIRYYMGYYYDEIEAARAYDKKAKELFSEFAYLNFPVI